MKMSALVIFILGYSVVQSAWADDFPRELVPELLSVEHDICGASTAYGRHFVVRRDIDHDRRQDVILDYSDAMCGGVPGFFCKADGCLLRVFVSRHGWHRAFDGRAGRWQVVDRQGSAELTINNAPFISH